MAITILVVYTISFSLMRAVPGGPFDSERNLDPEIRKNIEARYKLDQPLYKQYLSQLGNALMLDLGPCYKMPDFTVNEIIAQGFPISASLGILAMVFALCLGLSGGIVSALRRQTLLDLSMMSIATLGIALPNFVIAAVAILIFVFEFQIFPAAGWGTISQLVLPAACLGLPYAAYIARLTRSGMLDVLSQDYIRTARAKGLSSTQVVLRHALKGAMLPVVTYLGPASAGILTGSLVLERIFAIPGIGSHFIEAAGQRDYLLVMGTVLVYTLMLFTANTLVDVSYRFLDPRVRME